MSAAPLPKLTIRYPAALVFTRQIASRRTPAALSTPQARSSNPRPPPPPPPPSLPPQKRLVPFVLSIPRRLEIYFERYPLRRAMWCVISAGGGFYAGNTVTLSFGSLSVNDMLAAVITMVFYEVVSSIFYGSENPSLKLWFANFFKIGLVAALMAEAIKLGG